MDIFTLEHMKVWLEEQLLPYPGQEPYTGEYASGLWLCLEKVNKEVETAMEALDVQAENYLACEGESFSEIQEGDL